MKLTGDQAYNLLLTRFEELLKKTVRLREKQNKQMLYFDDKIKKLDKRISKFENKKLKKNKVVFLNGMPIQK